MNRAESFPRKWVSAIVLTPLVVVIVHGTAHRKAHVALSPAASVFVLAVIVAGPLTGLALMQSAQGIGALLVALNMAGALVFGFVNHSVFAGPDHIAHVDAQWRPLFPATAVLLALTEALGFVLAVRMLRGRRLG